MSKYDLFLLQINFVSFQVIYNLVFLSSTPFEHFLAIIFFNYPYQQYIILRFSKGYVGHDCNF
jgi:hypothetical protein